MCYKKVHSKFSRLVLLKKTLNVNSFISYNGLKVHLSPNRGSSFGDWKIKREIRKKGKDCNKEENKNKHIPMIETEQKNN